MMEEKRCWLCGRNGAEDPLDVHHIFGGANRKLSDRFGLTVYLCHERCHIFGPEAAHRSGETAERLLGPLQTWLGPLAWSAAPDPWAPPSS